VFALDGTFPKTNILEDEHDLWHTMQVGVLLGLLMSNRLLRSVSSPQISPLGLETLDHWKTVWFRAVLNDGYKKTYQGNKGFASFHVYALSP
jgi:hypothetical protein